MEVRHRRRPLWPMAVMAAVLIALVLAAFVIAGFPLLTPSTGGMPGSSGSSDGSPRTPTSPAETGASPGSRSGLAERTEFTWASALWVPPPGGAGMPQEFVVQGGTLADPEPLYSATAPLAITDAPADAGRTPVLAIPTAGSVVYVADDGMGSEVRSASLGGDRSEEVVAELQEIVWATAVEHDGSHAYLLLVDRASREDAGVVRVALDGSGSIEPVLGPAAAGEDGEATAGVRLAAIVGFRGSLILSRDDRFLVRWVCADPARPCVLDALDLGSGEERGFPHLASAVEVLGVEDELLFWFRCDQVGCRIGTTDLSSGEEAIVGEGFGNAALAVSEGAPVVVQTAPSGNGQALVAIDRTDGEPRLLVEGPGTFQVHSNRIDPQLKIVAPNGWVVAHFFANEGSQQLVAVRIADGETVLLPPLPLVIPPAPGVDG